MIQVSLWISNVALRVPRLKLWRMLVQILKTIPFARYNDWMNFNRGGILVSKEVKFGEAIFKMAPLFLRARTVQHNVLCDDELVFFDFWISVSGFQIPESWLPYSWFSDSIFPAMTKCFVFQSVLTNVFSCSRKWILLQLRFPKFVKT